MLKKILKGLGIFILVVLIALVSIPFLFEDKIKEMIVETINKNIDATVSFQDADLSLLKSFPSANVSIEKLRIINKAPFAGDTLVYLGELNLKMSVKELFKDKTEGMNIDAISTSNGLLNIIFNEEGIGNFDIAVKDDSDKPGNDSDPLILNIQEYSLNNMKFRYTDEKSKITMLIDSLNHNGSGDFSADKLDLDTHSTAVVSLNMDKTNYMNGVKLKLDAILGIDLVNSIYTFKENTAMINELPLTFNGSIGLLEEGQRYDLTFKTTTSSFKNFLGLIPSSYSAGLDKVQTTGDFVVGGTVNGIYSDTTVPKFNLSIASNNASFKYPDLPKSVQNIVIDTKIINETGVLNDTYVDLDKLSFRIDQDVFNAQANIRNVTENPKVEAKLNGTINLANVSKAYPIKLDMPLSGLLVANIATAFDMQSVENNQYEKMRNSGSMILTDFNYDNDGKPLNIHRAAVDFTTTRIQLRELSASTGRTDLKVTGVLENFLGFLLKDQTLKGDFVLNSNQFAVSDFMSTETASDASGEKKEAVKIPAFLDCTVAAKATTVLYDNLVLRNVTGKMIIKDQAVDLQNVKSDIFGGSIIASGKVSTKSATPTFAMDLGLNSVNIQDTFTHLEMLEKIAPIAGVINGKLNSTIKLSGNLDSREMTPNLQTIVGNLTAQLLSTTVNEKNSPMLTKLDDALKFIDLDKVNLNDLRAALTFNNGAVVVKPIALKYQDVGITVGGQHGFDQSMAYNLQFDVPAKYLGTEANRLLAQLGPADAAKIKNIPINAVVSGNFSNPKISTDMQQAVTNLATQLVQYQKDKLIRQGTTALQDIIKGSPKDTTKTAPTKNEDIKNQAQSILKGILNKKKEPATP
ncbi:MAG: AsmA family protein [Flavobacterium sp.]|nr:AsmA family protein [Flavobacterium sp.]